MYWFVNTENCQLNWPKQWWISVFCKPWPMNMCYRSICLRNAGMLTGEFDNLWTWFGLISYLMNLFSLIRHRLLWIFNNFSSNLSITVKIDYILYGKIISAKKKVAESRLLSRNKSNQFPSKNKCRIFIVSSLGMSSRTISIHIVIAGHNISRSCLSNTN